MSLSATWEATRIYKFITHSHASFHLRWKENLLNYQKVAKYYEHDCLQNFIILFISFLTALIVENSLLFAEIFFVFLKKRPILNLKGFQNCFQRQPFTKYLREALVFMWNSVQQEKFNFCFSGCFYWYWQNFHFGRRTEN